MYIANCSVCSQNNPEAPCICGASAQRTAQRVDREISREILYSCAKLAVILIPMVVFLSRFHGFGTDVLWLKTRAAIGMDTPSSTKELADLCSKIGRPDCAANAYLHGTQKFSKDLDLWLNWARLEASRKNLEGATTAYQGYFAHGGNDLLEHFHFARALQDSGHKDEAISEYQKMLEQKPQTLQVTVAQNMVRLMIEQKRLDEAMKAIEKFHRQGDNAGQFLREEMAKVQSLRHSQRES